VLPRNQPPQEAIFSVSWCSPVYIFIGTIIPNISNCYKGNLKKMYWHRGQSPSLWVRWQPQAAGAGKTHCPPKEKTPEAPPFQASSGA
jgi:hypothetical protein